MTTKTRYTVLEILGANITTSKPLPTPEGAEVLPLLRDPSKIH